MQLLLLFMHCRVHHADTCRNRQLVIGGDPVDRAECRERRSPDLGVQHQYRFANFTQVYVEVVAQPSRKLLESAGSAAQ